MDKALDSSPARDDRWSDSPTTVGDFAIA